MSDRTVALSLGSNEGNRLRALSRALNSLRLSKFSIKKVSRVWETEPWGNKEQRRFLNMCVIAETQLEPDEMLAAIKKIESDLGRTKTEHWGPREIDIDIIFIRSPGCGSQRLLRCRSHPAGRGPNSSSLFPPLAAVVAVASGLTDGFRAVSTK